MQRLEKLREATGGTYFMTGQRTLASEFDYRDGRQNERFDIFGTAEILTEYKDLISIGQPMDGISQLGTLHRQLLQEADFFANGRVLLKKLSPEEELDRDSIDFSKLPEDLRQVCLDLTSSNINISGLTSIIRSVQGCSQVVRKDALDWLSLHWEEYVELPNEAALPTEEYSECDSEVEDDFITVTPSQEVVEAGLERLPRPPRDKYCLVEVFKPNPMKEGSERRVAHKKARVWELSELYTLRQLENYLDQIRPTYEEDKALLETWGPARREEDRRHYLNSLRSQGLDFETIRRKMWATFDREPGDQTLKVEAVTPLKEDWLLKYKRTVKEVVSEEKSIVVTEKKTIPPPIWDLEKSKALCDLHQTKAQWRSVYNSIWDKIGRAILMMARRADTETRKQKVRMALARHQNRLAQEVIDEIVDTISDKDFEVPYV